MDESNTQQRIQEANKKNNANTAQAQALANMASKSANPYAKAAGHAVKVADKLNGGKTSERLGKALNRAGKVNPALGLAQRSLSGSTSSKTDTTTESKTPLGGEGASKTSASSSNLFDMFSVKKYFEEGASDKGTFSFVTSLKFIKIALIASVPVFIVLIFCCLFMSSSQIYLNAVNLGNADSVSEEDAERKIEKIKDEDVDKEVEDTNVGYDSSISGRSLSLRDHKLMSSNLVKVSNIECKGIKCFLRRKYQEADLNELGDFYKQYADNNKNYNTQVVKTFFSKLLYIQRYYRNTYDVYIDLPLIMSTLRIQSDDMNVVFKSNIKNYDITSKEGNSNFKYDKDWSNYKSTPTSSTYDIEVLAQHMVSHQVKESCVDSSSKEVSSNILKDSQIGTQTLTCPSGSQYKTQDLGYSIDEAKYKEYLKEFLEKKYYINGDGPIDGDDTKDIIDSTTSSDNPMADEMIKIANIEYASASSNRGGQKYITSYGGFKFGTPWCAIFVWYVASNTQYNGKHLYPDIIKYKTAGTGSYIRYFNSSKDDNINFYYNDNCRNLKGKNGSGSTYTPKAGDFVFFDWDAKYYDISSNTQDHTGIVEKYENGYIYTIEGNLGRSNKTSLVKKKKYKLSDCRVIGFGSWY